MYQSLKKITNLTEIGKFLNNCYDIKLQESMLKHTNKYRLRNLALMVGLATGILR